MSISKNYFGIWNEIFLKYWNQSHISSCNHAKIILPRMSINQISRKSLRYFEQNLDKLE